MVTIYKIPACNGEVCFQNKAFFYAHEGRVQRIAHVVTEIAYASLETGALLGQLKRKTPELSFHEGEITLTLRPYSPGSMPFALQEVCIASGLLTKTDDQLAAYVRKQNPNAYTFVKVETKGHTFGARGELLARVITLQPTSLEAVCNLFRAIGRECRERNPTVHMNRAVAAILGSSDEQSKKELERLYQKNTFLCVGVSLDLQELDLTAVESRVTQKVETCIVL